MRRLMIVGIIFCVAVLLVPTMLVLGGSDSSDEALNNLQAEPETTSYNSETNDYQSEEDVHVAVYRSATSEVTEIPLEEYVIGVVGSEMHASFELEALKAQALAARTFVLQYLLNQENLEVPNGAHVTDTTDYQVYKDEAQLKEKWGKDYEQNYAKVKEAVLSTKGEILTYNEQPISAQFFSTSNGYTENSEDYYKYETPYLKSVASPWDQASPRFTGETRMPVTDFEAKLQVTLPDDGTVGTILSRTETGRVASVNINGKEKSGREVRESLGLDSSDFQWQRQGNEVIIQTKGWGHGVGMSQYGANGMALEGKNYDEIVKYYYQDISIQESEPLLEKHLAKK